MEDIIRNPHVPITQLQQLSAEVNSTPPHPHPQRLYNFNQISKIPEINVDQRRGFNFYFSHRTLCLSEMMTCPRIDACQKKEYMPGLRTEARTYLHMV